MRKAHFWLCLLLLLQISAEPLLAAGRLLASGHVPPAVRRGTAQWVGAVAGTNEVRLALCLPLRGGGEFTNLLAALYRPGSPEYHHYLKPGEFAARFGATGGDYAAVIRFAESNGLRVTARHANRLVVDVAGRVADVERALQVRLNWYRQAGRAGDFFAPDREPTVAAGVPLLRVSGLDDYYQRRPQGRVVPAALAPPAMEANGGTSPLGTYMGNDFRRAYLPGTTLTGAGQNVALVQFDDFHPDDVMNYEALIGLTNNVPELMVMPVDGGVGTLGGGSAEVALDIEMVLAMSPGVSNIYVYEAPNPSPWVDILSQIANDDLAAQVSCSWSGGGPDPAAEQILQQMAVQGQSFFNAVGDSDAYTNLVDFPSGSPYATEVGGTYLATDTNGVYAGEAVWNEDDGEGSSGGVVLSAAMPVWQAGVDMTTNGGSAVWRDVPDVALTAYGVFVVADEQENMGIGTSCAAPLWAGVAALVNQQAAQLGGAPVGFLNPAIYALCRGTNYPALFHDIIQGNNTNGYSPTNFFATPGYDLCTGWGTPAGTNLINALTTPDPLGLLPPDEFTTSGMVGGPFGETNWVITVTNAGAGELDWALGGVPAWLTVSATNGTLAADAATNLMVQWVTPNRWPAGGYRAALMFTNQALSRIQNVLVDIEVGQSIVENGGFETGDFTGWTLVGDTITWHAICNVVATDADYPGVVHSGNFGALLGQNGYAATLSQTLATMPGQVYLVSFWLDNPESGSGQQFSAYWDGAELTNLCEPPAFTWSNVQCVVLAEDTNATLEFAAENDPHYFGFDDVTVTPVPPVAFTSYQVSTNGCQFVWLSLAGLNYQVQYTTNLAEDGWQSLGMVPAATNVTMFVDTNGPSTFSQCFYRLMLSP